MLDRFREDNKCPGDVKKRIERGEARLKSLKPYREECSRFYRNDQYCWVTSRLQVASQTTSRDEKAPHRVRTVRNIILPAVKKLVSEATQLAQGYQVDPTSSASERVAAAKRAEKIALWGRDQWNVADALEMVVTNGLVTDEGFIWPYFDNQVGTPLGEGVSTGEIAFGIYGGNEVLWEPGVRFEKSRWFAIQQARAVEDTSARYGFKPQVDAQKSDSYGVERQGAEMCIVTDYMERPSESFPAGRWLTIIGKRVVQEQDYPCDEDRPVLHKISWMLDPASDRDLGFVRFCLDSQRTFNDCTNKELEWKNLMLNPQIIVKNGRLRQQLTDMPGAVYDFVGAGDIIIREVPSIPPELSRLREEAKADIAYIASQNDIPSQVESGRGIESLLSRDSSAGLKFKERVTKLHADVMRDCLYLVQKHYTEPRVIRVSDEFGAYSYDDFRGSDLMGEVNVRVTTGPRSRQEMKDEIMGLIDRQLVDPEVGLKALFDGSPEKLTEDYDRDVEWADFVIRMVRDVAAGKAEAQQIPQARMADNHRVVVKILKSWMKTTEFSLIDPALQEIVEASVEDHEAMMRNDEMRDAELQSARAENLGMANAAKPQGPTPMPSTPA